MKSTLIFNLAKVKEEDTQFYLQKGFKITATDNNPNEIHAAYAKYKSYVDSKQLQFMNYNFSHEQDLPFSLSSGE